MRYNNPFLNEDVAHLPMSLGRDPIEPKPVDPPIFPVERWARAGGMLHKTYRFREHEQRDQFVVQLFIYESNVGHHGRMTIDASSVALTLSTENVDVPTELDKEYAAYADMLFRDICHSVT